MWPEILELVLAAHRHFGKALVGWDVAVTPDGPVLVEGNSHPTLDTQRPHRTPLGLTRFGEVVAHHLKRIEDEALTFDENRTPRA